MHAPRSLAALLLAAFLAGCDGETAPEPPAVRAEDLPSLPPRVAPDRATQEVRPTRELILALVGEVRGEIEPCGCPTLPYGGFVRRERQLAQLAKQGTLFHLDAGETLLKGFATDTRHDAAERARVLLRLSAAVGVDAWSPGPSDLAALDLATLRAAAKDAGLAAVSATWADASGALLFPPSIVLERGGLRLGVIGLAEASTDPGLDAIVRARDPVEAAREALAGLPGDLDLVVALGSLRAEDAERVGREVPGIGAVLTTQGAAYDEARRGGNGLMVEAPDRGRYVEALYLRLGSGPGAPIELAPAERDWRDLLAHREQVREGAPPDALKALEARFEAEGAGRNLAYAVSYPLAEGLDGAAETGALVEGFKAASLKRAAEAAVAATTQAEPGYASSGRCVNCHTQEFGKWVYTDHAAKAWGSLIARQATGNPECVGCHSTGFGEVGGFGDLTRANVQKFKNVQCESCHGPMRGHPDDPRVKSVPITPQSCVGCHDAANSPDFDFATYLPRASCQGPHGASGE